MDTISIGRKVFGTEIEALNSVCEMLDTTFDNILKEIVTCKGKIITIGMGKSGHVARKIAATMSSLGSCAIFLHPGECMHGDLGMIQKNDLIIMISYSGESDEIVRIIPGINRIGAKIIGITSNPDSTLAKSSFYYQVFPNIKEACHLGLAPTTSTTVAMVYGDALAVAASRLKGFTKKDFAVFHPAGSLGKKLTIRVSDLMLKTNEMTLIKEDSTIMEVILCFSECKSDVIPVVDNEYYLKGVITNGDIKRVILDKMDIYKESIYNMINRFPVYINCEAMAVEALSIMKDNNIKCIPVVKEEHVVGIISQEMILECGIYL